MAGECNNYGCGSLPEQTLNTCGDKISGGGKNAYIFACDDLTDFTDEAGLAAAIASSVAAGTASLFKNVKIGVPAGSPVTASAAYVAGQTPDTTTYDRAGTWMDANVNSNNDTAYATLNVTSGGLFRAVFWQMADEIDTWQLFLADAGIKFVGSTVTPDDSADYVHYEFTFNGRNKTGILPVIIGANIPV